MRKAKNIFANIDFISVFLYIILVFFGITNIYASQYNDDSVFTIDFFLAPPARKFKTYKFKCASFFGRRSIL